MNLDNRKIIDFKILVKAPNYLWGFAIFAAKYYSYDKIECSR